MQLRRPSQQFMDLVSRHERRWARDESLKLRAADLDLSRTDLGGIDLSDAELKRCRLDYAGLTGVSLAAALIGDCTFRGADLSGAWLNKAQIYHSTFEGASFEEATLTRWMAYHSDFRGADFTEASCGGAFFTDCDLRGARFRRVDLKGIGFTDCVLADADFTGSYGELSPEPINVGRPDDPRWIEGDEMAAWFRRAGARDVSFLQRVRRA
jgi:uncharacterized protein YjbI with pentapeptide repeats